jgi:hypothetical protein
MIFNIEYNILSLINNIAVHFYLMTKGEWMPTADRRNKVGGGGGQGQRKQTSLLHRGVADNLQKPTRMFCAWTIYQGICFRVKICQKCFSGTVIYIFIFWLKYCITKSLL